MFRNLLLLLSLLAFEPLATASDTRIHTPATQPVESRDFQGLPIYGTLTALGPGTTAWLDRGRDHGVTAGATWWLRVAGQPVARFDVLHAGPGESFGRLIPLAGGVRFATGMRFQHWHAPGRDQTLRTAVAFPDESGEPAVWIALPPGIRARGQRVRFGPSADAPRGVLDRRDDRFGLVRLSPVDSVDELAAGTPARIATPRPRDLVGRTFVPAGGSGTYVDLGRTDGLPDEAAGRVTLPDGTTRAVTVARVRDSYAALAAVAGDGAIPAGCRVSFAGDEAPVPAVLVAHADGDRFRTAAGSGLAAGQRVVLADARQAVAVGRILVVAADGTAEGEIWPAYSLRRPLDGDRVQPVGAAAGD